ncbi:phospholipid methyltransferase-domain-containing protein [Zopfochytrium polystomum]|nr:phospholipid methyltransferase-domain-containing protein [Zopfochytrium polystomum]
MAARSGATDGPVGEDDTASHQLHHNAADDDDNTVVVADTASATAAAVGAAAESELMLLVSPPRAFAAVNSIEPLRSSSSSSSSISTAHGSRSPVGSPVDEMPSVSLPPPAASAGGGDSALDGDPASPTADDDVSWGRTDTGLVFPVPPTQPLWQALFFPANHQSVFEWSVLTFVGIGIFLFLALPLPPLFFLCAFLFWRFCYNVGLGLILWRQSSDKAVVRLVRRLGFGPNAGRRRGPWTAYFVREIQKKVNISDEEYDALPLDFISWMLFRGVADVVIANDLVAYILFALCYFEAPANGVLTWMDVLRYTAGVIMIVVNYWAKFEVDQTLLDYAWYWGDFFFLMDASPTHSGLFEAAPHPMYIVGFLGYYATALITKSYTVLFVSLLAHSMQLGFLFLVENPHMEKTYNRPFSTKGEDKTHDKMIMRSFFQRDLVIFRNFDLFRSTDLLTVCVWTYTGLAALASGTGGQRLETVVLSRASSVLALHVQLDSRWDAISSEQKQILESAFHKVRGDAKGGFSSLENHFQSLPVHDVYLVLYLRVATVLSVNTTGKLDVRNIPTEAHPCVCSGYDTRMDCYIDPQDTGRFRVVLRRLFHRLAARFAFSLTYTGVYRFLNHPNAWASTASAWGVTMACESWPLTILTVFGQASNWLFVRYVEGPHMRRQYGDKVRPRNEAGVEKAFRRGDAKVAAAGPRAA